MHAKIVSVARSTTATATTIIVAAAATTTAADLRSASVCSPTQESAL